MTACSSKQASVAPNELNNDVARYPAPGEITPKGKRDADRGVQMRARDLAHEQDDAQHHQAGCHHGRRAADDAGERLAHHATPGGDYDEQEGAVQLEEQAPPFLAGIFEILDSQQDVFSRTPNSPARLWLRAPPRAVPTRLVSSFRWFSAMAYRLRLRHNALPCPAWAGIWQPQSTAAGASCRCAERL